MCDDGWDLNDAQVVCRQLGFGPAIAATDSALFGQGSGQILLKNLSCLGIELSIENCSHDGWGIEGCSHGEDAGVRCAALNGNFIYVPLDYVYYVRMFLFMYSNTYMYLYRLCYVRR